ncbi:MAG: non-canonical purine NTP diphosphatase [Cryomorphaceae bacterium]|jgi:XTP/dITP diphosphohydrolase|nr:non-canonical purine NTP diphosphatase [Cryomorphaceae bacterium]
MKLIFASHNEHKAKEIQSLLPSGIELLTLVDLQLTEEIPETAETLEGNALLKASYVHERFGMNCFADDTGLEVHALNGAPGVFSARYAGKDKDSEANMALLLKNLSNATDRRARFRTSIALIWNGKQHFFDGVVNGQIAKDRAGSDGFGYDPIFIPENSTRTFAEMTLSEKNNQSHRARALEKMIAFLNRN